MGASPLAGVPMVTPQVPEPTAPGLAFARGSQRWHYSLTNELKKAKSTVVLFL